MALAFLTRLVGLPEPSAGSAKGVSFRFGDRYLAAAPQHPLVTGHPLAANGGPLCTFELQPVPGSEGVFFVRSCATGKFFRLHNPLQERRGVADLNGDNADDVGALIRLAPLADGRVTLSSALVEDTYLGVQGEPHHVGIAVPVHEATPFHVVVARVSPAEAALQTAAIRAVMGGATPITAMRGGGEGGALAPPPGVPPFRLSSAQARQFAEDGFIVVPSLVPRPAVDAALRQINCSFGKGYDVAGHKIVWKDDIERSQAVTRLFSHTQALPAAEVRVCGCLVWSATLWLSPTWPPTPPQALLGAGRVSVPGAGQVAPRFPQPIPAPVGLQLSASLYSPLPGRPPASAVAYFECCGDVQTQAPHGGWHIDGMDSDRVAPFTLLACVVLSDTLEDNCGQLTVHPGDHRTLAAVIRREGAGFVTSHAPRPHLTAPAFQIKARAGDVVFAHPMLPHKVREGGREGGLECVRALLHRPAALRPGRRELLSEHTPRRLLPPYAPRPARAARADRRRPLGALRRGQGGAG